VRESVFTPTIEGEARLLLLIDAFSRRAQGLGGRTKLAKLDFLLRYPKYFERALRVRVGETVAKQFSSPSDNIETRMVRYRYGPWDPAYFALLGALKGRGLIVEIPARRGVSYKVTEQGSRTAARLAAVLRQNVVRLSDSLGSIPRSTAKTLSLVGGRATAIL
jgi:hypothetical protein